MPHLSQRHRIHTLLLITLIALLPFAPASAADEEEGATSGKPIYLEIKPPFVVNINDKLSTRVRFMQLKVQAMSRNQDVIDAMELNRAPLRHAIILLLAEQEMNDMRTIQGRNRVRDEMLGVARQVVMDQAGLLGPDALYFTDFVVQ